MKRITASKNNLPVLNNYTFNILTALLFCIVFVSCSTEEAPPDPAVLFAEAGEFYRNGRLPECRDLLLRVSALDPENPNVWRNLGTVSLDMGLYDEAVSAYQMVIQIDSTRIDVLTDVTGALLGAGRIAEALHTGQLATELVPEDGLAFNNYGMALLENGDFADAAMCFNTALRREPENSSVLYNCGRISLISGNFQEALALFEEACAADPYFLAPQVELARTYGLLGRDIEAEEQALAILAAFPGNMEAQSILALSYSAQGRQQEAITVLESLLSTYPGNLHNRLGLAECFYLMGDMPAALEHYNLFLAALDDTTGTAQVRLRILELEEFCD